MPRGYHSRGAFLGRFLPLVKGMDKENFMLEMYTVTVKGFQDLFAAVLKKGVEVALLFTAVGLLLVERTNERKRYEVQIEKTETALNRRLDRMTDALDACDRARENAVVQVEKLMAKLEELERTNTSQKRKR